VKVVLVPIFLQVVRFSQVFVAMFSAIADSSKVQAGIWICEIIRVSFLLGAFVIFAISMPLFSNFYLRYTFANLTATTAILMADLYDQY
jgi:hypothetical protein